MTKIEQKDFFSAKYSSVLILLSSILVLKGTMETSEGGVNVAQLNHGLDAGDFGLSHAMQVFSIDRRITLPLTSRHLAWLFDLSKS